jgi:hypothetical protein
MRVASLALLVGLAAPAALAVEARPASGDQFVIVPLRVHVLTTPGLDLANCRLSDAEVMRVVAHINGIWRQAGVHFGLESILHEPADQAERYRLVAGAIGDEIDRGAFRLLLPRASRDFDGLHVYIFHQLPYNSSFLGDDVVMVQELAEVAQVPGGGDDTLARVAAHGLGRALGVPNHEDPRNVMANATSGVALEDAQARRANQVARTLRGAMTVAEARKALEAADANGPAAQARRLRTWIFEVAVAVEAEATRRAAQPAAAAVPAYDQFLIVPLRAHILTAPDVDRANCRLSDADAQRVLAVVNAIWHRAGIHFGLESLLRETADQRARFRLTTDGPDRQFTLPECMLLPRSSRTFDGLHVYFFHELPFNGAYLGEDTVIVQEGARVLPVDGGDTDPVARVIAHALGSALGLAPQPDPVQLMAAGTSGVALDDGEVERARKVARTIPGTGTVAEVRQAALAAQSRGEAATALRLWSWLAEIPGRGAADAQRRRDKLSKPPPP